MAKNNKNAHKNIVIFDPIYNKEEQLDSKEEFEFYSYCIEAYNLGIFKRYAYQPESFKLFDGYSIEVEKQLKTKTKIVNQVVLREHVYSPDFKIALDLTKDTSKEFANYFKIDYKDLNNPYYEIYIDVKGNFDKTGSMRAFVLNQKWMLEKYGVYITKVVPDDFFLKFGLPEACKLTQKTKQPTKKFLSGKYTLINEKFKPEL